LFFEFSGPTFSFVHLSDGRTAAQTVPSSGWISTGSAHVGPVQRRNGMKKIWTKPTMCQVAAGFEISRYLPAEITPKK
jgi:hypothetical protein